MHPRTTRAMATAYGFDASKNAEIRGSWYRLCLLAGALLCCRDFCVLSIDDLNNTEIRGSWFRLSCCQARLLNLDVDLWQLCIGHLT